MRIVYVDPGGGAVELEVRARSGATVADLAARLVADGHVVTRHAGAGGPRSVGLLVDGRPVDPDESVHDAVPEAARVTVDDGATGDAGGPGRWADGTRGESAVGSPAATVAVLEVVGGLDAGRRTPLRPGPIVVGRGEGCDVVLADPTVSRVHATMAVAADGTATVTDAGSTNGSWRGTEIDTGEAIRRPTSVAPDAVLRLGAAHVVLRAPAAVSARSTRRPGPGGTVAVNRPPRGPAPVAPTSVPVPEPPPPPPPPTPVQVVAVIAPLVLAAVMVVVLGNVMFAAFALLSPVMAVGGSVEGRRRARRARRDGAAQLAADVDDFRVALAAAAACARSRLEVVAPDPAEVVTRIATADTRLWERRPGDHDWLLLRLGTGSTPWAPPLDGDRHPRPAAVDAAIDASSVVGAGPVAVALGAGGVLGIVGHRPAALAVARSLVVQAAAHHGPADVGVVVACVAGRGGDWAWARWLPHSRDPGGAGTTVGAGIAAAALAEAALAGPGSRAPGPGPLVAAPAGSSRTTLVVVDGDALLEGRRSPTRALLRGDGGPVAGIVLTERADRLPRSCTSVVELDGPDGIAVFVDVATGRRTGAVHAAGMATETATDAARGLARYDDPEIAGDVGALPAHVALSGLLDLDPADGEAGGAPAAALSAVVASRWAAAGADPRPIAPLGLGDDGPVEVDLAAHGPHALVAGTTGAGKSELLRTLVAGLAAGADPDHLTMVLVDFKGGGAFDACARLPHVVGLVTDLDEGLAERALRCLDAEVRHRERLLRAAGVDDLAGYRRARARMAAEATHGAATPVLDPLPRLVVVVDEFATLKAEVPGFVDKLVGVAQRGRSLGLHLVLATQRPAGAVSEQIRTNTGLRIALRVEDARDSTDVIDSLAAAALPRSCPGRACVRFTAERTVTIQTALVTGRSAAAGGDGAPVVLVPLDPVPGDDDGIDALGPALVESDGPTDLDRLVEACVAAWASTGRPAPRRPWPDPLPAGIGVDDIAAATGADEPGLVPVAVADDPDRQCQPVAGWRPALGPLLAVGVPGSGPSATLAAVALALAAADGPDRCHLYVLDHGAGALAPLGALPHCGAVAGAAEPERQARTVRFLRAELDRRRALTPTARAAQPRLVLLVDGLGGFVAERDDLDGLALLDALSRVALDGTEVGIHVAAATDRPGAARTALGGAPAPRWAFALTDPTDATVLGLRGRPGPGGGHQVVEGRGVDIVSGLEVQVAVPAGAELTATVARLAARWGKRPIPGAGGPVPIRVLPGTIDLAAIAAAIGPVPAPPPGDALVLAVGVLDRTLGAAPLVLHNGGGALVTGPPRSGRTSTLAVVARAAGAIAGVEVVALAPRRSPLATLVGADVVVNDAGDATAVAAALAAIDVVDAHPPPQPAPAVAAMATTTAATSDVGEARLPARRVVVVIDDADAVEDPDGRLAALAASPPPGVALVVAVRTDALRSGFGHWTRTVRRSRVGVLLRPDLALDGELLGVVLPRRLTTPARPGLGFVVVDGVAELAQLAHP